MNGMFVREENKEGPKMNIIRDDSKLKIKALKGIERVFWIDFGVKTAKEEQ